MDFTKIKVNNPLVELDGDEMARVMWTEVREKLIIPYVDIDILYFDLSLQNIDKTNFKVTEDAIEAIQKYKVGIKCATATLNDSIVKQLNLKELWKPAHREIRTKLDGTIFRESLIFSNIPKYFREWTKPIVIARHSFGDQFNGQELLISKPGKLKLIFEDENGKTHEQIVATFGKNGGGVGLGIFNTDTSIRNFAFSCFSQALRLNLPLYFTTKNTILKAYDGRFKDIFEEIYEKHYKADFLKANIFYEHRLIDDMVAYAVKSEGGYIWACKNYDGDVESDVVAQGFGSLGLMTSMMISPAGTVLFETSHGTVSKHFSRYLNGEETSTNSIATIFAWTRGLLARANLDSNSTLKLFVQCLESSVKEAVENGFMTKDLAVCVYGKK